MANPDEAPVTAGATEQTPSEARPSHSRGNRGGGHGGGDRGGRSGGDRGNRPPRGDRNDRQDRDEGPELIEKLVAVNRVAKVVKGGKRFGFAAIVIVGDGKGRVGYGTGKAREVPDAIRKATDTARKKMIRVPMREGRTLHHDVDGHFGSGRVVLRTAPAGTGVIAGGAQRAIFEALGIQDVVAKALNSTNPHNLIKATFDALERTQSPRTVAARRGKRVSDLFPKSESGGSEGQTAEAHQG